MNLYSFLLILYFIFFVALAIRNLKWATYFIIFALPSYLIRFSLFYLPMTLLEMMVITLFIVAFIKTLKYKGIRSLKQIILNNKLQVINYKYLSILVGFFLLSATMATLVSPNLRAAAGIWKAYFIEPVLFLLVFVGVIKKDDFKNIFIIFSVNVLFLSLVAVYQKITGNFINNSFWAAQATRRVTGVFEYPNALALYLAPIIIMLVGYIIKLLKELNYKKFKEENKNYKQVLFIIYYCLVVVFGFLAIVFTRSKGALFGVVSGLVFYLVFYKKMRKYFVIILLLVFFLGFYGLQVGQINLKGASTVTGGDSISVRLDMWHETWQMLKKHFLMGAGLAGYQNAMQAYHHKHYIEIYLYPHNIILNFWSELGLVGLLSFLLIVSWFYFTGFVGLSYKYKQEDYGLILMAGMTTLLIHGLVDVPYFKNDLSILWWVLIALMLILYNKKTRTQEGLY